MWVSDMGAGGWVSPNRPRTAMAPPPTTVPSNLLSRAKLFFRSFRGGEDILTGTFHDVSDRRHQAGPLHKQDPATFLGALHHLYARRPVECTRLKLIHRSPDPPHTGDQGRNARSQMSADLRPRSGGGGI